VKIAGRESLKVNQCEFGPNAQKVQKTITKNKTKKTRQKQSQQSPSYSTMVVNQKRVSYKLFRLNFFSSVCGQQIQDNFIFHRFSPFNCYLGVVL